MNIGLYGLLIVFGAFVLLLVFNPNLSCFGKRIKSPFYPVRRGKTQKERKKIKTEDYGFDLSGEKPGSGHKLPSSDPGMKTGSNHDEQSGPSGE